MVKILVYPNKILRQISQEVKQVEGNFIDQVEILKKELEKGENAAGLAAPQIGISKRFFGIKKGDKKVEIYINPKIVKTFGNRIYPKMVGKDNKQEDFLEGCLSVPDFFGTVKRYFEIEVEWYEVKGEKFVSKLRKLSGFEAIVWQHEFDHLDGKLFIDYIKKEGGKFYKWNGKEMVKEDIFKVIKEDL